MNKPVDVFSIEYFTQSYLTICITAIVVQMLEAVCKDSGVEHPLEMALLPASGFDRYLLVVADLTSMPVSLLLSFSKKHLTSS